MSSDPRSDDETVKQANRAKRRLHAAMIACVIPKLDEPYPDDPRWTPWTRFIRPAMDGVDVAIDALSVRVQTLTDDVRNYDAMADAAERSLTRERISHARTAERADAAVAARDEARAEAVAAQNRHAFAEQAARDAEAARDAITQAVENALDEHEPVGPVITGIPPSCPTCKVYDPCATKRFLVAAVRAAAPKEEHDG